VANGVAEDHAQWRPASLDAPEARALLALLRLPADKVVAGDRPNLALAEVRLEVAPERDLVRDERLLTQLLDREQMPARDEPFISDLSERRSLDLRPRPTRADLGDELVAQIPSAAHVHLAEALPDRAFPARVVSPGRSTSSRRGRGLARRECAAVYAASSLMALVVAPPRCSRGTCRAPRGDRAFGGRTRRCGRDSPARRELLERARRDARVRDRLIGRHPRRGVGDMRRQEGGSSLGDKLRHGLEQRGRDVQADFAHDR
jgi:hypothetical protein